MTEWLLIAGMALLTFATRYLPFGLAGRGTVPPWLAQTLSFVPIAVLSAIVVQATLFRNNQFSATWDNHHAVAAIAAFIVAAISKNLPVTVGMGLVVFWLAKSGMPG